jgi:hypothetical protein
VPRPMRSTVNEELPFQASRLNALSLSRSRDECNDEIINGRRGHLYFDGGALCLMVTDGKPASRSSWAAIGGKLWLGDISPNAKGQRVQDVKVAGIPLENAKLAIRMAQIKPKRIMTDAQKAAATVALKKAHSVLQGRTR